VGRTGNRIAAVQGAPGATIQAMFRMLVGRWSPSVRVAGVIAEDHGLVDRACSAGYLRSIGTGELFSIFQDLGPGSTACHLEGTGAARASQAVRQAMESGCDLVVLSKFGKLEAAKQGLFEAFAAAIEADVPVLTSVSPAVAEAWARFAAPRFAFLPADPGAVEAWWRTQRPRGGHGPAMMARS
jgi:hypothetical protein